MKTILILILIASSLTILAQKNLVPNGGFDTQAKKIKLGGQIELATGWSSPQDVKADLYHANAKNPSFLADGNNRGSELPEEGDGYAGIILYAAKGAVPRTYLQTELSSALVADKIYCVKYWVSLGEAAKYAVNNIGLYLSNNRPNTKEIDQLEIEPQIMHSRNKIFDDFTWMPICRTYKSKGGEKFITIGNFGSLTDTKAKKVKRPRGFTKPQKPVGYYFIETVSVIPLDSIELEDCICEKEAGIGHMKVVYSKDISEDDQMKDSKKLSLYKIFFDNKSAALNTHGIEEADRVVALLKAHKTLKIEVQGHTDDLEAVKADKDYSELRAKAVYDYIISKGAGVSQMSFKGYKNTKILDDSGTTEGRIKNRRVSFKNL